MTVKEKKSLFSLNFLWTLSLKVYSFVVNFYSLHFSFAVNCFDILYRLRFHRAIIKIFFIKPDSHYGKDFVISFMFCLDDKREWENRKHQEIMVKKWKGVVNNMNYKLFDRRESEKKEISSKWHKYPYVKTNNNLCTLIKARAWVTFYKNRQFFPTYEIVKRVFFV